MGSLLENVQVDVGHEDLLDANALVSGDGGCALILHLHYKYKLDTRNRSLMF